MSMRCHPVGLDVWCCAGLPEQEVAVRIEEFRLNSNLHPAETSAGCDFLLARQLEAIDQDVRVMHQALVARTYLHCFHPACFRNWDGENKVPVGVYAGGGEQKRLGGFHDEVRLAELPSFRKVGLTRQICGTALQHALFHPFLDELNLLVAQATLVREFQGLRLGQPRWHETRVRNSYDLAAVLLDILVGEQRKRPCLTGPVTRGTIFKDDGRDIAVERDSPLTSCRAQSRLPSDLRFRYSRQVRNAWFPGFTCERQGQSQEASAANLHPRGHSRSEM